MLPRVILFNGISIDGRMDGFTGNLGLYYEVAARWNTDAVLCGSGTIMAATPPQRAEKELPEPPAKDPADTRGLLVAVDSRGRCRHWDYWLQQPYWRDIVVLCSPSTPPDYLRYLESRQIASVITGDAHVDLRTALQELNARYGVKTVRVDSGGILNGVLLRAGLVDEVSVLISPSAAGGTSPRSIFVAPDLPTPEGAIPLRLLQVEKMSDDHVWLRCEVIK